MKGLRIKGYLYYTDRLPYSKAFLLHNLALMGCFSMWYNKYMTKAVATKTDVAPRKLERRPSVYKTQLADYVFNELAESPTYRTLGGLATDMGITRETLNQWRHTYPEFSDAVVKGLQAQEENLAKKLIRGDCNTTGTIFVMKNSAHRWSDKQEIKQDVTISDLVNEHKNKGNEADWDKAGGIMDCVEDDDNVHHVEEWRNEGEGS